MIFFSFHVKKPKSTTTHNLEKWTRVHKNHIWQVVSKTDDDALMLKPTMMLLFAILFVYYCTFNSNICLFSMLCLVPIYFLYMLPTRSRKIQKFNSTTIKKNKTTHPRSNDTLTEIYGVKKMDNDMCVCVW